MSMSMHGNVMHGISCHHHHHELFVCQCVLQPAIPACLYVCVSAESTPVQAAVAGAHTPKKKRECVCVGEEEERETASQMNQPSEATSVCVCEEDMRKEKREKREKRVAEEEQKKRM